MWHDYVVAPGQGIVAVRTNNGGTISWRYLLNDHLGSTTVLTNTALPHGQVVERDSYDAWGNRRNANGNDSSTCSLTSQTSRGYTGQEMLDTFCLVDLNACLYDPRLARFLSPDSMVPDPANTQSYNRHSYTNNNPLNAIDPTGHLSEFESLLGPGSAGDDVLVYGLGDGGEFQDYFGDDGEEDGLAFGNGSYLIPNGNGYASYSASTISKILSSSSASGSSASNPTLGGLSGASNPAPGSGPIVVDTTPDSTVTAGSDGIEDVTVYGPSGYLEQNNTDNYGFYYAAYVPNPFPRPSKHQMGDDFTVFRSKATSAYIHSPDDPDPPNLGDAQQDFQNSQTGQYFLGMPTGSQGYLDFKSYELEVSFDLFSGFNGKADSYEAKLYKDAGY